MRPMYFVWCWAVSEASENLSEVRAVAFGVLDPGIRFHFTYFWNLDVAMAPREKGTPESTRASPIFNIAVTSVDGR